MTYRLVPTQNFLKDLKRLKKKYASIYDDLIALGNSFIEKTEGWVMRFTKTATKSDFQSRVKGKEKVEVEGSSLLSKLKIT
jgi:mRNA-degrading endonuclease RelE of RelBE toxin-antitoxin system